jgi:fructokinase
MRIGIDLGGTKIEGLALGDNGKELTRHRVPTPDNYRECLRTIAGLVDRIESQTNDRGTVGIGTPGITSPQTGLMKNSNTTWLNGTAFQQDIATILSREVRCANDANCLAVSEATDGAAAGARVTFAVILGTGTGAGIAIDGQVHSGRNGVAGEWGHNGLPWPSPEETPGPECYCGMRGCLETWISGTGMENDHRRRTGQEAHAPDIAAQAEAGDAQAVETLRRYENRLIRGLAQVINFIDPDVIVLGGGMSNIERLYRVVPAHLSEWVFGREAVTPIRPAAHGDSSGVRGAAWLWPQR